MSNEINIELIALCLSKNGKAQRKVYDIMLPYLNVMCRRYLINEMDIKDVLQETFINIFKNLNQFDIQKASFKTWATRIAINNCLKFNAKYKKNVTEEFVVDIHEVKISPEIFKDLSNKELIAWLKKMPRNYFEVFNMYVIDGFSHDEIANVLGIETTLSRKRLSRARTWVKKRLETNNEFQFKFHNN